MTSKNTTRSGDLVPVDVRRRIRARLLAWYDAHKRDLPWRRRSSDPYAQWVAEIMLQQTRVETVINYYERFLRRFPTVEALARANHQTVLKHWEGLGYYRRILHLHDAVKSIARNGQTIPHTATELRELRGIGDYTSAAIASIAFNEPVAAVDGNVARVIARLFAITDDVLSTRGKRRIQSIADQLVPPKRPGNFNQAWMDLGSMICTPQSPNCSACPLKNSCKAHEFEMSEELPIRGGNKKKKVLTVSLIVGIFTDGNRVLIRRRPTGGLWSGLWEFPNDQKLNGEPDKILLARLASQHGVLFPPNPLPMGRVEHQLSHRLLEFEVYVVRIDVKNRAPSSDRLIARNSRWVTPDGLSKLAVSTAHRKVLGVARGRIL